MNGSSLCNLAVVLHLSVGNFGAYIGIGVFNAFTLEPIELFYRGDVEQLLAVFDEGGVDTTLEIRSISTMAC